MLKRVTIKNFRCFRHLQTELQPLTVLIGPNDSGKSTFLGALERLATNLGWSNLDHWRMNPEAELVISADTSEGSVRVQVPGTAVVRWPAPELQPVGFFRLPCHGVPMESQGYPDVEGPQPIAWDGSGVPSLLDYLLRRDRPRFFAVAKALQSLIPGLDELEIATPTPDRRRLDLVIEKGVRIPADQASAGVRLLLFFVALAYHPSPPRLILLEEPENGIHPKRLADVIRLLREVTRGEHGGQAAQVILTTHSPFLVDHVDLDQDQVLVFQRKEDGSRTAEPVDASRLKTFLDEFMLGEVWFNQEEEGLVAQQT